MVIEKSKNLYRSYLKEKRSGKLASLSYLLKNDTQLISYLNNKILIECSIPEKFYMEYNGLTEQKLCPTCNKQLPFHIRKGGYFYDGNHRYCNKSLYNKVVNSYIDLIGMKDTLKMSIHILNKIRLDIIGYLNDFKIDFPEFNYCKDEWILILLSNIESLSDLNSFPRCKMCNNVVSLSEKGIKIKKIIFNEYCRDHLKIQGALNAHKTIKDKYGVNNISQLDSIKKKKEETLYANYGVTNMMHSKELKNKFNKTIKDKYGVNNISQLDSIKKKKEETVLKNFGNILNFIEHTLNNSLPEGCTNWSQLPEIKEKKRQTFLKNYGVDNIFKDPEFKEYLKQYWLGIYGVEYIAQAPHMIEQKRQMVLELKEQQKLNNEPLGTIVGPSERKCLNTLQEYIPFNIIRNCTLIKRFKPDGYIKELNICIEYDEAEHFNSDSTYVQHDINRQKYIEDNVGSKFFRVIHNDWINIDKQKLIIMEFIYFIKEVIDENQKDN